MTWNAFEPAALVEAASAKLAAKAEEEAAAAAAAAAEEEAAAPADDTDAPAPAPAPVEPLLRPTPLEAAQFLLADDGVKGALGGSDAAEDFAAVCEHLALAPIHPAISKGLAGGATFVLKGWKADLPSMCALLAVLEGHAASVTAAKFWGCGLDPDALTLLASALPQLGLESLALEGEPLPLDDDSESGAQLMASEKLTSLSLRCASLERVPAGLIGALPTSASLTSLSLFGNHIGDAGAAAVFGALRVNTALTRLDLGRCGLGDACADALLRMVSEEEKEGAAGDADADAEPPAAAPEAAAEGEGEEAAPFAGPNRTLTALNLSYNSIGTAGRLVVEAAQAASPALATLSLCGNPCLACGPTAAMGVASRDLLRSSWAAVEGLEEGGSEALCTKLALAALGAAPDALPAVGYEPPPPPPEAEGADADAAEGGADPKPTRSKGGRVSVASRGSSPRRSRRWWASSAAPSRSARHCSTTASSPPRAGCRPARRTMRSARRC